MYRVYMETLKSARRHGAPRAYLARLAAGERNSIDRFFVKPRKINANRAAHDTLANPGDVFEARRWLWDMNRQQYFGGTVWFGVQTGGTLCRLTRDEAFAAVAVLKIGAHISSDVPMIQYPSRIMPDDIRCLPVESVKCLP